MLEVLNYLRANGFKTYIVNGGGLEFVRVYSQNCLWYPARAVRRIEHPDQIGISGRQTGADAGAESIFHRRHCRQARLDQFVYRRLTIPFVRQ